MVQNYVLCEKHQMKAGHVNVKLQCIWIC